MTYRHRTTVGLLFVGSMFLIVSIYSYRTNIRPMRFMDMTMAVVSGTEDCVCIKRHGRRVPGEHYIYTYEYNGRDYQITDPVCECPSELQEGYELMLYVDPEKPQTIVPEMRRRMGIWLIMFFSLFGLIMVSIGGFLVYHERRILQGNDD